MFSQFVSKFKLIELFLFFLLSYPMFYYAYKFGSPDFGNKDFYSYYDLYKNWNFKEVESPFNTRLISTFFIYLFNKVGFFYETKIAYNNVAIDKKVFFNAIFFNYISTVLTSLVIYITVLKTLPNRFIAFSAGILYLLGFGTLFYNINTLTEAFSFFLFSLIIYCYLNRNNWLYLLLVIAIIQREYIFFVMGFIALVNYFFSREGRKFNLSVLLASIICFVVYIVLRKTIFFTPLYADQMDISNYWSRIINPTFLSIEYVKQSFLNQNILILYILLILYKWRQKMSFNKTNLLITIGLYLQAHFITFIAVLGNSCGRYFYITSPLLVLFIVHEAKEILHNSLNRTAIDNAK